MVNRGRGDEGAPGEAQQGWGEETRPSRRGLEAAGLGPWRAGERRRSPQPRAAPTPPPPFTQRGPGTPLPALAVKLAQACGLCSLRCRRAGLGASAPAGVVRPGMGERGERYPPDLPAPNQQPPQHTPSPDRLSRPTQPSPLTLLSAPARPPGRLYQAKAMATGRLLRIAAAAALLSLRGEGRVPSGRRRPAETPGKPTSFFFLTHPPPPTPAHTRKGFPDTLAGGAPVPRGWTGSLPVGKVPPLRSEALGAAATPCRARRLGTVSGSRRGLGRGPLGGPPAPFLSAPAHSCCWFCCCWESHPRAIEALPCSAALSSA